MHQATRGPRLTAFFLGLCAAALLAGCNDRVLVIRRESPAAIPVAAPSINPQGPPPVVAIPLLERADADRREPDYTAILPGAERILTNLLQQELAGRTSFRLVDRRHVRQILGEHAIQRSFLADPKARKKLGRQLAADYLLVGTVAAYCAPYHELGRYATRVQIAEVSFSLDLVDVETGLKLWKVMHSGTGRRLLSDDAVRFTIDPVLDAIEENDRQDKARLADLPALAELLLKEALAGLK